jgi:NAD dependent epimerase/dehydratase family enzyme
VRLVAGGLADEALGSAYVVPAVLEKDGFSFTHPTLETALRAALDNDVGAPA